ncbi:hypothetical protein [Nonomuraea sp. KM88]|uniref:hypothetical protein n=1 Tax=Nonomuraea sp. KM88 TaxID=3457427 RepID=UPI003FCDEE18
MTPESNHVVAVLREVDNAARKRLAPTSAYLLDMPLIEALMTEPFDKQDTLGRLMQHADND